MNELQQQACLEISKKLLDLKLLKGSVQEVVEKKLYQAYYPHGIGHYLGMDVHDVGLYKFKDKPRKLEAGMVITVEPGIYIPINDISVPKEMRRIGVRIEDNIHVTSSEPEILTAALKKEVSDLELSQG